MQGGASCTPQLTLFPGVWGWGCPQSRWCRDCGVPAGWHSGTLPQRCPAPLPRPLPAGRVLLPSPGRAPRWGQRAWHGAWAEGCRDNGSSRPQNGDRMKGQPKGHPAPHPPHPSSPGGPLAPSVPTRDGRGIAACARLGHRPGLGTGGDGWARAGLDVAGGWALAGEGLSWDRGVQFGWRCAGAWLPWGEAPSARAPWSGTPESLLRPLPGGKELFR